MMTIHLKKNYHKICVYTYNYHDYHMEPSQTMGEITRK